MRPTTIDAIRALAPDVSFSIDGDAIVAWRSDSVPQPTSQDIAAKLAEMQAAWDAEEWRRNRVAEYPTLDALLVALWESSIEGRPATADELQAIREAVKQKYPKPQG